MASAMTRLCMAVITAVGCIGFAQAGTVSSGFDSGLNGWGQTFNDNGSANVWVASGGNPGGYLQSDDSIDGWGYVVAPAAFLSAGAGSGSSLSFDLRTVSPAGEPAAFGVRVAFVGAGLNFINQTVVPTTAWANYGFSFVASTGWRLVSELNQNYDAGGTVPTAAQFAVGLAGLSGLYIAADYTDGNTANGRLDRTEIDNVVLIAVPELPRAASMLAGLLGLGALLLRRHRTP